MDRPALRWLRAALLTGVALGSGTVAHLSTQGLMPGWPALAVMTATGLVASHGLLARPASRLRVVLLCLVGQLLTHGTLTALAGHRGHHEPHAAMALAHVAAAVVVGLWLAAGERALWTIVALLVDGVLALCSLVARPVPALRPARLLDVVRAPAALPLLDSVLLARGP